MRDKEFATTKRRHGRVEIHCAGLHVFSRPVSEERVAEAEAGVINTALEEWTEKLKLELDDQTQLKEWEREAKDRAREECAGLRERIGELEILLRGVVTDLPHCVHCADDPDPCFICRARLKLGPDQPEQPERGECLTCADRKACPVGNIPSVDFACYTWSNKPTPDPQPAQDAGEGRCSGCANAACVSRGTQLGGFGPKPRCYQMPQPDQPSDALERVSRGLYKLTHGINCYCATRPHGDEMQDALCGMADALKSLTERVGKVEAAYHKHFAACHSLDYKKSSAPTPGDPEPPKGGS